MGFSLVGPSGDQKTTNNLTTNNYSASVNPQMSLDGAGPGASAINISPLSQGATAPGNFSADVSTYYAPIDVSSIGTAQGDSAISSFADIAKTALQTQTPAALGNSGGSSDSTSPGFSLSDLFSGNTIYWILGGIVVLFLAHHPAK